MARPARARSSRKKPTVEAPAFTIIGPKGVKVMPGDVLRLIAYAHNCYEFGAGAEHLTISHVAGHSYYSEVLSEIAGVEACLLQVAHDRRVSSGLGPDGCLTLARALERAVARLRPFDTEDLEDRARRRQGRRVMADRVELIESREHHALAPAIRELKALSRLNFLVNAALQTESPDDDVDGEILYDLAKELEYLGLQIEQLHKKQPPRCGGAAGGGGDGGDLLPARARRHGGARRPKGSTAPSTGPTVVALPPRAGA